ncbi:myosin-related [Abeliophyllum distichum]|uniref:Myosin-related n=1 Tax=Abeliophyllum distichum TaxID=126358 RepID=A0ABD1VU46_9LAMI
MSITTITRRTKWHPTPPPPPSPKILNLPRSCRTRRKQPKTTTKNHPLELHQKYYTYKGNLESLFDQENDFEPPIVLLNSNLNSKSSSGSERRVRVEEKEEREGEECGGVGGFEEDKWRFQAEILRAECNFLRMEREFAMKKLERNRVKMERTLRSAVQTLVSGRNKIFEGKNVSAVLEEEIEDLAEKLEELTKTSRAKGHEFRNCSNFDKKACVLQRRLEKLGGLLDDNSTKELHELAESTSSITTSHDTVQESSVLSQISKNKSTNVDKLRRNMEGLSKGMLEGDEEDYVSILSSTANSSVASSASTSKRIDQGPHQESILHEIKCSGRCKAIVRKIVDQVRAETEQWSQMQEMLRQVRGEMEELQASRDFWENRVNNSQYEIQSLKQAVEDWREKALSFENKANELQTEISTLKEELQKSKIEPNLRENTEITSVPDENENENLLPICSLKKNHCMEDKGCLRKNAKEESNVDRNEELTITKDLPQISLGKQLAKEKRMLLRQLRQNRCANDKGSKEELEGRRKAHVHTNVHVAPKQSPLRDIGNMSPLVRQYSKAIFPLQSPENCRMKEGFRKRSNRERNPGISNGESNC